nr:SH3 domain-containing protein 2-like [Ipomoea batatas]
MGCFLAEAMFSYHVESDVELNLSVGDYIVVRKGVCNENELYVSLYLDGCRCHVAADIGNANQNFRPTLIRWTELLMFVVPDPHFGRKPVFRPITLVFCPIFVGRKLRVFQ